MPGQTKCGFIRRGFYVSSSSFRKERACLPCARPAVDALRSFSSTRVPPPPTRRCWSGRAASRRRTATNSRRPEHGDGPPDARHRALSRALYRLPTLRRLEQRVLLGHTVDGSNDYRASTLSNDFLHDLATRVRIVKDSSDEPTSTARPFFVCRRRPPAPAARHSTTPSRRGQLSRAGTSDRRRSDDAGTP